MIVLRFTIKKGRGMSSGSFDGIVKERNRNEIDVK